MNNNKEYKKINTINIDIKIDKLDNYFNRIVIILIIIKFLFVILTFNKVKITVRNNETKIIKSNKEYYKNKKKNRDE